MTGTDFPEANCTFGPPPGVAESQVHSIRAFKGEATSRFCDGTPFVIVAWQPSAEDLKRLNEGQPVFLLQLGGLSPHYLATDFKTCLLASK